MAIDSLAKRNSVIAVSSMIIPIPDSTIDQGDRQTLSKVYRGILADVIGAAAVRLHEKISISIGHLGF